MASTDRGRVSILRESVAGVLPASPSFQIIGVNSENLGYAKTTIESGKLDYSAQPVDTVKVGAKSAGSLSVEWSPGTFNDLLEAAFRSTFGNVINVTGAAVIVASAKTLTLAGAFTEAVKDQWVLLSGFVAGASYTGAGDSPNNGWYKIASVTGDNAVVLADPVGRLLDETAPVSATIKSRRMINGTRKISHAIEVAFTDVQAYFAYLGQYLNSASMSVSAGAIVTGELAFMGEDVLDEQGVQQFDGAVGVTASSRTITAPGAFSRALAGQAITLSGFSHSGNNATGKIDTVVSDDAVTLTSATTTLVNENTAVNYTGVVSVTASSRTIQAIGAFAGMSAGRSITISGMVTGGNNVTGVVATVVSDDAVTLTSATTTLVNETGPGTAHIVSAASADKALVGSAPSWAATGSYALENETGALNATNNVGDVYIDGALSAACFKTINWTVTNNLRETQCVGLEFPRVDYGTPAMTGSFERMMTDIDLWRAMKAHETIALEFGFIGQDGASGIHFSVPEVRINTDPLDLSGGKNSDVYDKVDWSASKHVNDANEVYYVMVCVA